MFKEFNITKDKYIELLKGGQSAINHYGNFVVPEYLHSSYGVGQTYLKVDGDRYYVQVQIGSSCD